MKIAAYCHGMISGENGFFKEFADKHNHQLVKLYTDTELSRVRLSKHASVQSLLSDAEKGMFNMVIIKDISYFTKNPVESLKLVKALKSFGVECSFVDMEFKTRNAESVLESLALVAQDRNVTASKSIKQGKKKAAEKGRVPNLIFGYDKTDVFSLSVNPKEAEIVRRIFHMYVNDGLGVSKISRMLNDDGIKTKRGCSWSQNAVTRILSNEIYIGRLINGKEEIKNTFTGERIKTDKSEWVITENESLRIVDNNIFEKAKKITATRQTAFKNDGTRNSTKHIFSSLIKCSECGASFRQCRRKYKNVYISWVCSGRNTHGVDYCSNNMVIDETDLADAIKSYFADIIERRDKVLINIINAYENTYNAAERGRGEEINERLSALYSAREKYMDMYVDGIISRKELNDSIKSVTEEISLLENELKTLGSPVTKDELEESVNDAFEQIESLLKSEPMRNEQLKKIIEKMVVYPDGAVDICLKVLSDAGLEQGIVFN